MKKLFFALTFALLSLSTIQAQDISQASFTTNFKVKSEEINPQGIAFNTDGTKMFIVGHSGDEVNEYALSSGFDVSTASFTTNFNVKSQEGNSRGLAFNTDGTKMFIVGSGGDDVNEYALSSGFDISTASFTTNFSVISEQPYVTGITFNSDGTKMFTIGQTDDEVNAFNLSSGFDISTASFSQSFSVAAQEATPQDLVFNANGTKMFVIGATGDDVNEYTLSSGFDISTASFSQKFSVAAKESYPSGLAFSSDGSKMFVLGTAGDDVNEYQLSAAPCGGTVGNACDDGDANTTGETVQADCSCGGGTTAPCGGTVGDACDDGDANTTGETVQADCSCGGGTTAPCGGTVGNACDDGDANTTGETVQADCSCGGGTPTGGGGGSSFFTEDGNAGDIIYSGGKVVIGASGTNKPGNYQLYVEGGILTELAKVSIRNSASWSDYVFADDYERNTLKEVETFVKENKHLPNVPSADEVAAKGINVAEMDATLLRQIEELWLHMIELKKENEQLKLKLENLEKNK